MVYERKSGESAVTFWVSRCTDSETDEYLCNYDINQLGSGSLSSLPQDPVGAYRMVQARIGRPSSLAIGSFCPESQRPGYKNRRMGSSFLEMVAQNFKINGIRDVKVVEEDLVIRLV